METHQIIKALREQQKISQEELAAKVGYKDRSSIAKVEAGKVDLSQTKIAAFAAALGVTPAQLMGIDKDMHLTITDTDPQLDELNRNARQLNAQGLQKLVDISDDMVTSGKYQKTALHRGAEEDKP